MSGTGHSTGRAKARQQANAYFLPLRTIIVVKKTGEILSNGGVRFGYYRAQHKQELVIMSNEGEGWLPVSPFCV